LVSGKEDIHSHEVAMKHIKFAGIVFVFILCLGPVLALGTMKIYSDSQQRKARNGLDLVVANDLPDREGFEVVEIVSFDIMPETM
jgi:hypothetical protein